MAGDHGRGDLTDAVDLLLTTDPADVGCSRTWALIHVYAELVAVGADPEQRFPGIAAHLSACPPCSEDHEGLVNALMTAEWVAHGGGPRPLRPEDARARPGGP